VLPRIDYLHWIHGRPAAASHDLGASDLQPAVDAPTDLADAPAPDRDALAATVADEYGVARENVLVAAGATHANALAAAAALAAGEPDGADGTDGDEGADDSDGKRAVAPVALVEKPGYEPLGATPELFGADVDRFLRPADDAHALDPDRVDAAIRDETTLVTVSNRHNPSGALASRETLRATAETVAAADAHLLVDEVYAPFVDRRRVRDGPFGGVSAVGLPNTVVTGSLTKFHGRGELRIGWLVADESFVERARVAAAHFPSVADPSLSFARAALADGGTIAAASRELLAENHRALADFVHDRDDIDGTVHPDATFAFLAHDRADGDAVTEAAWDAGVLVVPGRFFEAPDRVRVSLAGDPDAMRAGLDALGDVLDEL
jgi:aspartate/methionine/tyrosine aminotransferase